MGKGTNMADTKQTAELRLNGQVYQLPIHHPSAGPDVIDIRSLYKDAGVFTYDPGFTSTASCDSTITFIDGANITHAVFMFQISFQWNGNDFHIVVWVGCKTTTGGYIVIIEHTNGTKVYSLRVVPVGKTKRVVGY